MKTVEVRLFTGLRKYRSGELEAISLRLDDEARLGDVYGRLGIPRGEVAIAMVNGKGQPEDYRLQNGDRIGLFPLIAGG